MTMQAVESRESWYALRMAYDQNGRPIVDGKPYDAEDYELDAALQGLDKDGHALHAARLARMATDQSKKESAQ
jgi:hypothetical protein